LDHRNLERELNRARRDLAQARAAALAWERYAVWNATSVTASLVDQVALARALARVVEARLEFIDSAAQGAIREALGAFRLASPDKVF